MPSIIWNAENNEEIDPIAIDGSVSAEAAAQRMQDRITEVLAEQ